MVVTQGAWYLSAAIGCTIVVGVMSLLPDAETASSRATVEADHVIAYLVLTCFWLLARREPGVYVLLGTIAYGLVLELLQIAVPGRTYEWLDVVANTIGAFAGWGALWLGRKLAGRDQE